MNNVFLDCISDSFHVIFFEKNNAFLKKNKDNSKWPQTFEW